MVFCIYPSEAGHNEFFEELAKQRIAAGLEYVRPVRHDGSIIVFDNASFEMQRLLKKVASHFGWASSPLMRPDEEGFAEYSVYSPCLKSTEHPSSRRFAVRVRRNGRDYRVSPYTTNHVQAKAWLEQLLDAPIGSSIKRMESRVR